MPTCLTRISMSKYPKMCKWIETALNLIASDKPLLFPCILSLSWFTRVILFSESILSVNKWSTLLMIDTRIFLCDVSKMVHGIWIWNFTLNTCEQFFECKLGWWNESILVIQSVSHKSVYFNIKYFYVSFINFSRTLTSTNEWLWELIATNDRSYSNRRISF